MTEQESASRLSVTAALRQVITQLFRLLEENDPSFLLQDGAALTTALASWRKTVAAQTTGVTTQRARELENAKLEMMARVAQLEKERNDLLERNKELLAELVKLKKHEGKHRQMLLEAQFAGTGHRAEAKRLDLEVRSLRHQIRGLEGGPPLSATEAAPRSKATETAEFAAVSDGGTEDATTGSAVPGAPSSPNAGPSVQDRRAAAEAAFQAMWKPKAKPVNAPAHEESPKTPKKAVAEQTPTAPAPTAKPSAKKVRPTKPRASGRKTKAEPPQAKAATAKAPKKPATRKTASKKAAAAKASTRKAATAASKKAPTKAATVASKKAPAKTATAASKKAPAKTAPKASARKTASKKVAPKPAKKKAATKKKATTRTPARKKPQPDKTPKAKTSPTRTGGRRSKAAATASSTQNTRARNKSRAPS